MKSSALGQMSPSSPSPGSCCRPRGRCESRCHRAGTQQLPLRLAVNTDLLAQDLRATSYSHPNLEIGQVLNNFSPHFVYFFQTLLLCVSRLTHMKLPIINCFWTLKNGNLIRFALGPRGRPCSSVVFFIYKK